MVSILGEVLIDDQFSPVFYAVLMAASGIIFALILGLRVLVILLLGGMRSGAGEDGQLPLELRTHFLGFHDPARSFPPRFMYLHDSIRISEDYHKVAFCFVEALGSPEAFCLSEG